MATVTRSLEVVRGSLDGEVLEIPAGARDYWHVGEGARWAERYEVQPVAKRDAEGRVLRWTRDCLVHVETIDAGELLR